MEKKKGYMNRNDDRLSEVTGISQSLSETFIQSSWPITGTFNQLLLLLLLYVFRVAALLMHASSVFHCPGRSVLIHHVVVDVCGSCW